MGIGIVSTVTGFVAVHTTCCKLYNGIANFGGVNKVQERGLVFIGVVTKNLGLSLSVHLHGYGLLQNCSHLPVMCGR